MRWAIAGRQRTALESIKDRFRPLWSNIDSVPILLGDNEDDASLDRIAQSTHAVISLSGPYNKVGEGMVAACVRNGTHYVDLTGTTSVKEGGGGWWYTHTHTLLYTHTPLKHTYLSNTHFPHTHLKVSCSGIVQWCASIMLLQRRKVSCWSPHVGLRQQHVTWEPTW